MANNGWIKLNRSILTDETWLKKPFSEGQAMVDLMLMASYEEKDVVIHGETVHLMPGDVVRSQRQLAERWGWSRAKVRRFISGPQKDHFSAHKKTGVHVDISTYSGNPRPTKRPFCGPQKDTYKNIKNKETEEVDARAREEQARAEPNRPINVNTEADSSAPRPTPPTFKQIYSFCVEHGLQVDVQRFFDYYDSRGWKTATGKPVTDWRQKLRDWADADKPDRAEQERHRAAVERGRKEQAEREARLEAEKEKELEERRAEKGWDAPKSLEELKKAVLKAI